MKIKVKTIPRASVPGIEELKENELKVKLKSPPVEGKANQELIKLLADYYKIPKSRIEITKGLTSRNKIIKITAK
jgi:hypothetical protein